MDDTLGELPELVDFVAQREGLQLQLIEVMPEIRIDMLTHRVDLDKVRAWLSERANRVHHRAMHHRAIYELENGATVELVDPVANATFCANCHRLRITHDGQLKGCLNRLDDLLPTRGKSDDEVRAAYREVVANRRPYYLPSPAGGAPNTPRAAADPQHLYASLKRPIIGR